MEMDIQKKYFLELVYMDVLQDKNLNYILRINQLQKFKNQLLLRRKK